MVALAAVQLACVNVPSNAGAFSVLVPGYKGRSPRVAGLAALVPRPACAHAVPGPTYTIPPAGVIRTCCQHI
eukprot:1136640-Amphidinium_carterae.1